jgi:hypothetical protein
VGRAVTGARDAAIEFDPDPARIAVTVNVVLIGNGAVATEAEDPPSTPIETMLGPKSVALSVGVASMSAAS